MKLTLRLEILSQQHAHVYPAQSVGLNDNPPASERRSHDVAPRWISPAHDDPGRVGSLLSVTEEDHIETSPAEHPRGRAGRALPAAAVQHLDHDAALRRRDGVRMSGHLLAPGDGPAAEHRGEPGQQQDGKDQREAEGAATRLFQKRNVGSGMGHRERMM